MLRTPPHFAQGAEPDFIDVNADGTLRLIFRGAEVLVAVDGSLSDARAMSEAAHADFSEPYWVGKLSEQPVVVQSVPKHFEPPAGHEFKGLRALWGKWSDEHVAVAGRAFQIQEWARTHRYCGACGSASSRIAGERGVRCPQCGHTAYPRISPAMMVLVRNGEKILLARNATFPPNRYSALAGFLEVGESIEEAVHREVKEEVGLDVANLRYFASQSWPFPHSLMIAFTADYAGGEVTIDGQEIVDAQWFGPGDALPDLPPRVSIARALVNSVIDTW